MIEANIAIICSRADPASMNIRDKLLKMFNFKRIDEKAYGEDTFEFEGAVIITMQRELLYADDVESFVKAKYLIFASRHAAESGMPAFLAHTPGNWTDEAPYGGKPRSICIAMPLHLRRAILILEKLRHEMGFDDWRCGLEVTHHGPYIEKTPAMFIELGSTLNEWKNDKAGEVIAQAIMELVNADTEVNCTVATGFGGPHYAPQFNRLILNEKIAIGHIIPKYVFPSITKREVKMAIERTSIRPSTALIDWKGLKSSERQIVLEACNEIGIEVKKI